LQAFPAGDKAMKGFIASNVMRTGRALVALVFATLAFVWLLGMWGGLPPAEARGPAMASTAGDELRLSATSMMTIYLPILFKSDVVFFDDFSSTSSGWLHNKKWNDDNCEAGYNSGRYRVKAKGTGTRCLIHNGNVPSQVNGTFKISVRRTSSTSYPLLYGFIFGAGADAEKDRWALEVYPNKACNDKPFFWLVATVNGDAKFKNYEQSPNNHECTSKIDTDQDDWNHLMVIRNGANIKVYVKSDNTNGYEKIGEYNASYLLNQGNFSLQVVSAGSNQVVVEYDDLEINRRLTP